MSCAEFKFDVSRTVLEIISLDTGIYATEAQEVLIRRSGAFIISAAHILLPSEYDITELYKYHAFTTAGAAVLESLETSDLAQEDIKAVTGKFAELSQPIEMKKDSAEATYDAFEREAIFGIKRHPELRDHLDYLTHYYLEITQNTDIAKYTNLGAGFTANRMDLIYDSVMNSKINEWAGISDVTQINWDQELINLEQN